MGLKKRINFYQLSVICCIRGENPSKYSIRQGEGSFRLRLSKSESTIAEAVRSLTEGLHTFKIDDISINIRVHNGLYILYKEGFVHSTMASTKEAAIESKLPFYYDKYGNMVSVSTEESDNENFIDEKITQSKAQKEVSIYKRAIELRQEKIDKLEEVLKLRKESSDVEIFDIVPSSSHSSGETVSISLLSDIHIEETVKPESVLGLNEYNPDVAKRRLSNYFINVVKLVSHHQRNYKIKKHVLGLLGDVIGGYIHNELRETNSMSPLEAISFAKSCLMSGFKYLQENLDVDSIDIICIVGNHGRNTDKTQFANLTETSYEWFLYDDLRTMCQMMGYDKLNFIIPKAGFAITSIFGHKYMFAHGNLGFSYQGGIGGLYVPFLRYFGRMAPVLGIERIFFGHYHTTIDIDKGVGNGSVKGYDAYAMSKGLPYEEPKQSMVLLDEKLGFTNFQSIFLD